MDKNEALKILINVANAAQKAGIFTLADAEIVAGAVKSLLPDVQGDVPVQQDVVQEPSGNETANETNEQIEQTVQ